MRRDPSPKTPAQTLGRSMPPRPSATLYHPRSALSCSRSQDVLVNLSELCKIPQTQLKARVSTYNVLMSLFLFVCFKILNIPNIPDIRESAAKQALNINL